MRAGELVAGRFEIVRRAERGGMAMVYRAVDRQTGAPVAIKILRGDDPVDRARFAAEQRTLAALRHPGIVEYIAHGQTPRGPFIAMEWLEGEDLLALLKRRRLSVADSVRVVRRAADALGVAHARGLVHRDIKPGNLFLVGGVLERVKVLDFGVVLQTSGAGDVDTPAGMTVGTPAFMAPEQARATRVDARADVFSLGCVLFRCLAGRAPFSGDNAMAVMLKIVLTDAPRASEFNAEVPGELDELVARALAREPAARPADAAALAAELAAVAVGDGAPQVLGHRRRVRPSLTGGERRLMSVVLIGPPPARPHTPDDQSDILPIPPHAVAARFGGHFDRLADGSAVVTLEQAGTASDQAAQAARCALAMRRAVPDRAVALATGRGEVHGSRPVGEAIDRAVALLEFGAGDSGVIRVDDLTAGLLDARFDVEGYGFGKRLEGEREVSSRTRTLLGRPTSCVGRVRELGFLQALFSECATESAGRCALLVGPAGIGKSRVRDELVRRLERADAGVVLAAHGDPMRAGSPYGMAARVVRHAADIREAEPLAVRQNKLRERIAHAVRGEDLQRVTEFLGELAGVPFSDELSGQLAFARRDPIVLGDQMQRAWYDWLEAETAARPVVLVLEDIHWCDRATLRLVEQTRAALADRPLLALMTSRPEGRELFPALWQGADVTEIDLKELSPRACGMLAREVLGRNVDNDTVDDIVARSAGNAFYLEELIRAVAAGRRDELPETVLAMVQARLAALDGQARSILRAASVFGRVFWLGGVEALLGESREQRRVRGWLEELADLEVVTRASESGVPGQEQYVFRHALVREAAYESLTAEDRALGHRLAGEWLESVGEPDAMILAAHFDRGGELERAREQYRRAAEQALEANEFATAIERSERAVALRVAGAELGANLLLQAEARRWLGDHAGTLRAAAAAIEALPGGGAAWFTAAGLAAIAAGNLGDRAQLAALADGIDGAAPVDGEAAAARAVALARAVDRLLLAGDYARGRALLDSAERAARDAGARGSVAGWLHRVRGFGDLFRGRPAGFTREMVASVEAFEDAGDVRNACMQRGNLGYGLLQVGDYERAEVVLREALASAEQLRLTNVITSVRTDLGGALALSGRAEEARELLIDTVRHCVQQRNPRLEGPARAHLSEALARCGDLPGAEREARLAAQVLAINPPARAAAHAVLAIVLVRRGRVDEAVEVAAEAHRALHELGVIHEGAGAVRLAYAEALDAAGRVAESRAALHEAVAALRERAADIDDDALRRAFVDGNAVSRRTLALARAWAVD